MDACLHVIEHNLISLANMSEALSITHLSKSIMTTDVSATDRVVLATPDLQKLIHRLKSIMYTDENNQLVETFVKCLKDSPSNAKTEVIAFVFATILNDCLDEIIDARETISYERTLLDAGELLFAWLREYRDYIITHSDWKQITNFYLSWVEGGGFNNKHSESADSAMKMILALHSEFKDNRKKRKIQYNWFFSILSLFSKRCDLAHLPRFASVKDFRLAIKNFRKNMKSGEYEFKSFEENQTMYNCLDDLEVYYKYDAAKNRITRSNLDDSSSTSSSVDSFESDANIKSSKRVPNVDKSSTTGKTRAAVKRAIKSDPAKAGPSNTTASTTKANQLPWNPAMTRPGPSMSQPIPPLEKLRQSSSKPPSKQIPVKSVFTSDSEGYDLLPIEPLEIPVPTKHRSHRINTTGKGSLPKDPSTGGGAGTAREYASIKCKEKSVLKPRAI